MSRSCIKEIHDFLIVSDHVVSDMEYVRNSFMSQCFFAIQYSAQKGHFSDFEITGSDPHPHIAAPISV